MLFLLQPTAGSAIVDMKNANYSVSFIDYRENGNFEVGRSYNSRSNFNGMFGFGWCSNFEDRLLVSEQKLLYVHCGAGTQVIFRRRRSSGNSGIIYFDSPDNRVATYENGGFVVRSTRLAEEEQGAAISSQVFDAFGNLTTIDDGRGRVVRLERNTFGLTAIISPLGQRIGVEMSLGNKIRSLSLPGGLRMIYGYDQRGNLISNKNGWGNTYRFSYDDLHNLVRIDYPDSTFITLSYDTQRDWVIGLRDRRSCVENYRYQFSVERPEEHYWADVSKSCPDGTELRARYEFVFARRQAGGSYLYRLRVTNVDGSFVDSSYDQETGRPTELARSSGNQVVHQVLDK
jgi:YD repeat-containing protein